MKSLILVVVVIVFVVVVDVDVVFALIFVCLHEFGARGTLRWLSFFFSFAFVKSALKSTMAFCVGIGVDVLEKKKEIMVCGTVLS